MEHAARAPIDIAKLALFLASGDSEILNGAALPADFGSLSLN
jgi:hypothetical protein